MLSCYPVRTSFVNIKNQTHSLWHFNRTRNASADLCPSESGNITANQQYRANCTTPCRHKSSRPPLQSALACSLMVSTCLSLIFNKRPRNSAAGQGLSLHAAFYDRSIETKTNFEQAYRFGQNIAPGKSDRTPYPTPTVDALMCFCFQPMIGNPSHPLYGWP